MATVTNYEWSILRTGNNVARIRRYKISILLREDESNVVGFVRDMEVMLPVSAIGGFMVLNGITEFSTDELLVEKMNYIMMGGS